MPDALTRCPCGALVNPVWPACAACHEPIINPIIVEPARCPDGQPLSPVYWERASGEIVGPAKPDCLAKVGHGLNETYWVIVEYEGQPVWIRSDFLRSKKQFETQVKPTVVELIKESTPSRRTR